MITTKLRVVSVYAKNCNFILNLDHENSVGLGIYLLDVLHERAEGGDLASNDGFVVVGNSVMVRNPVGVNCPGIRFLVGNDVHGCIEIASEVSINRPVAAGVMTEPVQNQLQMVLFTHPFCMFHVRESLHTLLA